MNDKLQTYIEPEMEARIVALVLGEASAFEAEELERLIAENAELQTYQKRLEKVHGLVGEAHEECDESKWKLSEKRRGKVFSMIEKGRREYESLMAKQRARRQSRQRLVYACAACLVVSMIMLVTTQLSKSPEKLALKEKAPGMSRAEALARVDQDLMAQRDLVADHKKDLTVLVQQYGIPYFDDGESNPLGRTEQDLFRGARQRLADFEVESDRLSVEIQAGVQSGKPGAELEAKTAKLEVLNEQVEGIRAMVDNRKDDTIELSLKQNRYSQSREAYEQSRGMLRDLEVQRAEIAGELGFGPAERPAVVEGNSRDRIRDMTSALAALDVVLPNLEGSNRALGPPGTTGLVTGISRPGSLAIAGKADVTPSIDDLPLVGRLFQGDQKAAESRTAGIGSQRSREASDGVAKKPVAPSSAISKVIVANTTTPSAIPVPLTQVPEQSTDFGDGADFGDGWTEQKAEGKINKKRSLVDQKSQAVRGLYDLEEEEDDNTAILPLTMTAGLDFNDSLGVAERPRPAAAPQPTAFSEEAAVTETDSSALAMNDRAEDEFGLDGPFASEPASNFFLGGGTVGREASRKNQDFIGTVDRVNIPGIPASPQERVSNIVTSGLRSGAAAINRSSIDAILNNPRQTAQANSVASKNLSGTTMGELKKKEPTSQQAGNYFRWSADDDEKGSKELWSSPRESTGNRERDSEGEMDSDGISASKEVEKLDPGRVAANGDSGGGGGGDIGGIDPFAGGTVSGGNFFTVDQSDFDADSFAADVSPSESGGEALVDNTEEVRLSRERAMQGADLESIRFFGDRSEDEVDTKGTNARLNQIIIPEVNFENVTVEEALAFIEKRTKELDSTTLNGAGQGLKIQVKTPKVSGGELNENDKDFGDANDPNSTKIKSLNLKNVPARVALQYIADAAKLRYRVDGEGVTLLPLNSSADADITQRRWKVSPEVAKDIQEATANGKSFETVLKENGIAFMANSGAHFLPDENTLIIRNSPTNLKLVDGIMGAAENAKAEENKKREADWLIGEDSLEGELASEEVTMDSFADGERSINAKGNQIIIPEVRFKNTTVAEALKFVRLRSIEFDNTTVDDNRKGINIVVADPEILVRVLPDMDLDQVPLKVLLDKIGEATGTTVEVDLFAYRLAKGETSEAFDRWEKNDSNQQTTEKMNQIILPEMLLRNSSMAEALEFLRLRSNELDTTTLDYEEKGIEIVIDDPKLEKKILEGRQIAELDLKNVPLRIAIQEIARQVGCKVRLEEGKLIFFSDPAKTTDKLPEGFETSTAEKSDSTFSLNVSDVSFKLAKAALAGGSWPDASKVRPEEFVNALDYDDTKPRQAEKVACEIEQGSHPFMQQRNLMRIAMSTASLGRNAVTPLRLTILLDQSGSMERADRAESVQRAFALLAAQLNPNDEVTLVGFARTPRLLAERVKGNEMAKLAKIIANPLTEGGTNLEEALSSGLQLAKQQFLEGAQNRIILVTDGAANLGDALPENLAHQVASMRRAGIAFDACGVGADGLNDDVLSSLAKQGDGRYYFLDRPEDADAGFARQIAGALRPAAKNVKVQILFNPDRVSTFKLYGFEKHKLKKEDFRNDAVDAAEMAAEESGVALYHFEPLPEGRGDIGTVSLRFLDTASNEMVERTWAIPYLADAPLFSEAKPTLRLASVAGLFAEKLKASPVGDRVDLKRLRQEVQLLKPTFQNQARFNEFQTMLQQAGD